MPLQLSSLAQFVLLLPCSLSLRSQLYIRPPMYLEKGDSDNDHMDEDPLQTPSPSGRWAIILDIVHTAFGSLASTSTSFLLSPSAVQSTSWIPAHILSMISPTKQCYTNLTDPIPETPCERLLQDAVREMEAWETVLKQKLVEAQAGTVLSNSYCVRVKGQLAEKEKKKGNSTRLVGDGMPIYMTDEEFFRRVKDHEEMAAQETTEKEEWRVLWEERAELLRDWKEEDTARKKRNARVRLLHKGRITN